MPTAAKLMAAVCFAVVAYVAADQYAFFIPDGRPPGLLREISALIGVICGWSVLGRFLERPRTRVEAMGTGIRTSATMAFFTLLLFSIGDVLNKAIDGRYKDPKEALLDVFARAIVLGTPIVTSTVLAVLLLGGLLAGAIAQMAGARWK